MLLFWIKSQITFLYVNKISNEDSANHLSKYKSDVH